MTTVRTEGDMSLDKKIVDISDIRDLVSHEQRLTQAINEATADLEKVRAQIKERMGDATEARVNGAPVFTFALKNTFRWKDIKAEHGNLVQQYMRTVETEEIDKENFLLHHPAIAANYQVREFRRVTGLTVGR